MRHTAGSLTTTDPKEAGNGSAPAKPKPVMTSKSVVSTAVSGGTFIDNAYLQNAGSLNTNPFSNGATNYTTFAAWKAAVGTTDAANFA